MVFSSIPFLFYFLPAFFLVYYAAPGIVLKNVVLLGASLIFYAWGEPWFVLVLASQVAMNYAIARIIDAHDAQSRKRAIAAGIAVNLLLLGIFKYADFVVGSLNLALSESDRFALPGLALPLGISFFTFHSISYLIDVYRGQVSANRNLLQIAIYIAMFPQLVAGPIIRYHTISRRLGARHATLGRASAGIRIFIIGLAQKVLIADEVARIAERVFDHVAAPSFAEVWLGLGAYSVQIYFDFLGYSNMAIGLGLALGFAFPRNFNMPYTSRSITEFWRRWHISLSQWLRDYLYIPLGGSHGSALETYRNLWLVFLLCGLWHGANWTFVIWGAHHGFFLVIERAGLRRWLDRWPMLAWLYALLAVMIGWVWFRAHDFDHAMTLFGSLVGLHGWGTISFETHLALFPATLATLIIGAVLSVLRFDWTTFVRRSVLPFASVAGAAVDTAAIALFFGLSVLSVAAGSYSPFLYFRF